MGVKGLFQFLKRFERSVHIPQYVRDKSVGIDIFWFLYQSKGDMFSLQNALLPIINNASTIHCVFDGRASKEKKKLLENQANIRKDLNKSIKEIETFLSYPFNHLRSQDKQHIQHYLIQLKRQAWQPTPEFIEHVKSWLLSKGCNIHKAIEEADDVLFELQAKETIDIIVTNDSDLLTLGSHTILRPETPIKASLLKKDIICENLGFTEQQWSDFMYLCRYMKDCDVTFAYSLISVYKELDYVLQKYSTNYDNELIVST
jgi:5'-3' exonuclease